MNFQNFLELCQTTLATAWNVFSTGVILYCVTFFLSGNLIIVALNRLSFFRFLIGITGCLFSMYIIWVIATYFPTITKEEVSVVTVGLVSLNFIASALLGIAARRIEED
jgi:hypothetical protein